MEVLGRLLSLSIRGRHGSQRREARLLLLAVLLELVVLEGRVGVVVVLRCEGL